LALIETVAVSVIVVVALAFAARSIYRSVSRKTRTPACGDGSCPISDQCGKSPESELEVKGQAK
jgi:hypothetical protein